MRCLGLYCFLDGIPTSPASHLVVLRQVLITHGEASAVRAVAAQVNEWGGRMRLLARAFVEARRRSGCPPIFLTLPAALCPAPFPQALGDIAVAHGVKEVDRCLMAELAGGLVPGLDPELQQKPCADLLLDLLRQWTDDFSAAAAKKKAVHRRGSRGSGEELEALGALGAALVEALARLVRSHLRWQAREVAEAEAAAARGETAARELALEDVEVVKVGGGGSAGPQQGGGIQLLLQANGCLASAPTQFYRCCRAPTPSPLPPYTPR